MPSGAKRRKAAKKKKEKEVKNNNNINLPANTYGGTVLGFPHFFLSISSGISLHRCLLEKLACVVFSDFSISLFHFSSGIDDPRTTLDEKDSDADDASSPASLDLRNCQATHPFNERGDFENNEEGKELEDASSISSFVSENQCIEEVRKNDIKSAHQVALENRGAIGAVTELKPVHCKTKDFCVEYRNNQETLPGQSSDRGAFRVVPESEPVNCETEAVFIVDTSHGKSLQSQSSDGINVDDKSQDVEKHTMTMESEKLKEVACNLGFEVTLPNSVSEEVTVTENGCSGKDCSLAPAVNSVEPVVCVPEGSVSSVPEKVNHDAVSEPDDKFMSPKVIDLGSGVKEKKFSSLLDGNAGVSSAPVDLAIKKNEEVFSVSYENAALASRAEDFATKENEDKLAKSSVFLRAVTRNDTECVEYFEVPESSENQPLIASTPEPMQEASWKSCCGLLEVLTGSHR